jgi:hypothetical protein
VTGRVVPPQDIASLRLAIETLLGSPDTRAVLGAAARRKAALGGRRAAGALEAVLRTVVR